MGLIIENHVVKGYDGTLDSELEVPSGTTMIAKGALKGCLDIEQIYLPFSMKYIQSEAFEGCSNLTFADLGQAESIGRDCFRGCAKLEEVVGTEKIQYVYKGAFLDCPKLEPPVFPKTAIIEDAPAAPEA